MKSNTTTLIAAISMAMAVILGAFGAHALKQQISSDMLTVYNTGVTYHFYHALGLLGIGVLMQFNKSKFLKWASWLLITGTLLFSFSLYALALTGIKGIGIITPFGGTMFIIGWIFVAIAVYKK